MMTLHKNTFFIAVSLLSVLVSCDRQQSPETPDGNEKLVPVTVGARVPETKVSLDNASPVWQAGDEISVFTSAGAACPQAFTAGAGGSKSTTFSGMKPSGSTLAAALYPYDADATISKGSKISTTLEGEQSGEFSDAPMVGSGGESDGFTFQNVCCVLKIEIPSSQGVYKVEVVSDERVSGDFTVDAGTAGVSSDNPSSYLDKRASISTGSALSGVYFISVLPSESKEIGLAFTDSQGNVAVKSASLKSALSSGSLKNLGKVKSLEFNTAALVADPTSTQL